MKILYGYAVVNPQWACKIDMERPSRWECIRATAAFVLGEIYMAALFAGSVVSFAYAFGAFR